KDAKDAKAGADGLVDGEVAATVTGALKLSHKTCSPLGSCIACSCQLVYRAWPVPVVNLARHQAPTAAACAPRPGIPQTPRALALLSASSSGWPVCAARYRATWRPPGRCAPTTSS